MSQYEVDALLSVGFAQRWVGIDLAGINGRFVAVDPNAVSG